MRSLDILPALKDGAFSLILRNRQNSAQGAHIHPYLGYTELPDAIDPTSFPKEADHTVEVMIHLPPAEECGPFHFNPVGLHVEPGDIVRWEGESDYSFPEGGGPPSGHIAGDHTITAYSPVVGRQRRIPETATPFSSPIMGKDVSWYYQFDTPGVYDIYCGPHEGLGMVMRVVVGDVTETEFGPGSNPEAKPGPTNDPTLLDQIKPLGAASGVFANLDPEVIHENGSIDWDEEDPPCPEPE
ncbi:MAG: plastocyanin/azurin family copper-binding protein [Haloarculaceae archaeon]